MARRTLRQRYEDNEIRVEQWFERDRGFVGLYDRKNDKWLAEWQDEAVSELIDDGFFKTGRLPFSSEPIDEDSVIEYAEYIGVPAFPRRKKKKRR